MGREGHFGPPQGGLPKILKKNVLGHVTYQSKAHENLYSNKSIKCSFDHSFDRHQLKIIIKIFFFHNCFIEGSMSTPNGIGSWVLVWTFVLTYISIFWTKLGGGVTQVPPSGGINTKKIEEIKLLGHVTYQSKAHKKHCPNVMIKCSFNALYENYLKITFF